jgi:PAS domain S-box-containing protein
MKIFDRLKRPALWLTLLVFVAAIFNWIFRVTTYALPAEIGSVTSLISLCIPSVLVAFIAARGFLISGKWSVLWLGTGALVFGLSALLRNFTILAFNVPNTSGLIHNFLALFGAVFYALAAFFEETSLPPLDKLTRRHVLLLQFYAGMVVVIGLVWLIALNGLLSTSYSPGVASITLRQMLLVTTIMLLIITVVILWRQNVRSKSPVIYWFSLSLLLLLPEMIAYMLGTETEWQGTLIEFIARSLSGIYMFVAVLFIVKEAKGRGITSGEFIVDVFTSMETRLKESEDKYRNIVETASEGIWIFDLLGKTIFVNKKMAELLGFQQRDMIDTPVGFFMEQETCKTKESNLDRWLHGITDTCEQKYRRQDGSPLWAITSTAPLLDKNRNAVAILSMITDITDIKQTQQALENSEKKYRAFFENLNEYIIVIAPALDEHGEVVDWICRDINHLALTALKNFTTEPIGKSLKWFMPPVNQLIFDTCTSVLKSGRNSSFEFNYDGYSFFTSIFKIEDELLASTTMDITDRKRAEEVIKNSNKMLEVLVSDRTSQLENEIEKRIIVEKKLKEQLDTEAMLRSQLEKQMLERTHFMRVIVHELKTPLTALLAGSELLLEAQSKQQIRRISNQVRKGAIQLDKTVGELFDLARGDMGSLGIDYEDINTHEILSDTLAFFKPEADARGVELRTDCKTGCPGFQGDRQRITQILNNLLDNALKYTKSGSITLGLRELDGKLLFSVQDTGCGIKAKKLKILFKPYHEIDEEDKRRGSMGIGLAICKMLVELHGGQIWAESLEGTGSKFSFTIPLKRS